MQVGEAVAAFRSGRPVMVFDSDYREKETDLLWPAAKATPGIMRRLRKDCGGLLFLAIGDEIGEKFGVGEKVAVLQLSAPARLLRRDYVDKRR